ncbi:SCO3374 family protein [Streptomyces kunmingensis]|uniref:SCO3374 family protein n=1 Tax=Streptomyces kunmingensis TaxID=68225 RepID=A0ABU6CEF8_9ACTN|nr:SCO3374 family protein [Streptomyces kunmingensis]MEB3963093.1 SCO3374 family protein [Streptomyces kunmingensis]
MVASSSVPGTAVPTPRRPLDAAGSDPDPVRQWYEDALGWAGTSGPGGTRLRTGLRFDVLELPADAGFAMLHRCDPRSPVAVRGETMQLLVAAGSADELPGLLDWLEWGALPLDLVAVGADGFIHAPTPPGWAGPQEAATWVRPPEPGSEMEPVLPALTSLTAVSTWSVVGGGGGAPDLVRLVDTAATYCHRARLRRASAAQGSQPLAFS